MSAEDQFQYYQIAAANRSITIEDDVFELLQHQVFSNEDIECIFLLENTKYTLAKTHK